MTAHEKAGCALFLFVALPFMAYQVFGVVGLTLACVVLAYCLYLVWGEDE